MNCSRKNQRVDIVEADLDLSQDNLDKSPTKPLLARSKDSSKEREETRTTNRKPRALWVTKAAKGTRTEEVAAMESILIARVMRQLMTRELCSRRETVLGI